MAYFEINHLHITHRSFEGTKTVLDIGHLEIAKGETYGLVGESGQGKTVLALAIQQLLRCPPGKIESGEILLDGQDLLKLKPKQMQQQIRGKKIAMIFQDPMSCLNPVFTVGQIMTDVLHTRNPERKKLQVRQAALELLQEVKLADAESTMSKYPHQLSGGQRQRVIIALALACRKMVEEGWIPQNPIRRCVAAVSAGIVGDVPMLDLCYEEDSHAMVDLNCVMDEEGRLIELQGTGEGRSFTIEEQQELVRLCAGGIETLIAKQKEILGGKA